MTALGPSEIAASRRPFVVLAIAGLRALLGFCLASPLAALVAASDIGLRPEGDRALFEGGGYLLLELLRLHGSALGAAIRGLLPVFLLGLVMTSACSVVLLVALDVRERLTSVAWLARAWARLPAQLVVGAGASLVQGSLLVLATLAFGAVPEYLARPVATSSAQAAVVLPFVLLAGGVGGFADLVKASLVRHPAPLGRGLASAWGCVQRSPVRSCFGWLPYALPFIFAVSLVAKLSETVDVSRPGEWRLALVFAAHQLVVLISVACRAAWFARALRFVATSHAP